MSLNFLKRYLSRLTRNFQHVFEDQHGLLSIRNPEIDVPITTIDDNLDERNINGPQLDQEIVNRLIQLMVISKNEETRPMLKNEQLMNIYKHWNLYHKNDLPFINPTKYTPFEFQSIENDDISYINNPRLSVTKLLISGWCELRELYRVFAGSVRTPPTKAMSAGTKLHLKLEQALHGVIDLEDIENFIRSNTEEIMEMYDLVDNDGIFDMNPDDSIAIDWSEIIIERLYSLIVCSESREVILHGYLNLQKESFVENEQEIKNPSSVLVSGIVDQIQFENPENSDDFALFDEVQKYLDVEYEQVDETPLVDLSRFFDDVKNIIQCYPEFQLKFTDLKTRMVYQIPLQKSVLDSAKFQTFYYRYFFELLSKDANFAYRCLLENAKRRGLDVDKPLSVLTTFRILRRHYHLFYNDFLKLADGKPIGFAPFDLERIDSDYEFGKLFVLSKDFAQHQEQASQHLKFIESLGGYDSLEYDKLLLPLLKTWKTPPTLRYLAARSAQFYEIFGSRLGDTTTVEYRNTFTGKIIDTKVYNYNNGELETETIHASDFWNGKLDPEPTNDFLRCQYCEFKSKCAIPKIGKISDSHASIGPEVRKFLNDVKHLQKDC